MKMMTKEIEDRIPPLGFTDGIPAREKIVHVKFFAPVGSWTWYAVEFDPEQELFFGWVDGDVPEWGYFGLAELKLVKLPFGLGIERDLHFGPTPMGKVKAYQERGNI